MKLPGAYLGTMTFGWNQASSVVDDAVAAKFIETFTREGGVEVDCARIYSGGESEAIVGRVLKANPSFPVTVTTKGKKLIPTFDPLNCYKYMMHLCC